MDDIIKMKGSNLMDELYQAKLLLFIAELFYAFGLFFAKISILSLYWRMFRVTGIRLPIQILFGCSLVWITFRVGPPSIYIATRLIAGRSLWESGIACLWRSSGMIVSKAIARLKTRSSS